MTRMDPRLRGDDREDKENGELLTRVLTVFQVKAIARMDPRLRGDDREGMAEGGQQKKGDRKE